MELRRFILASSSPRRRDLLAAAGFTFEVDSADIDEVVEPGEDPLLATCRLAAEKVDAVARRRGPGELVLAADTSVICDGRMFGKPDSPKDACTQLGSLAGRNHQVVTAWALVGGGAGESGGLSAAGFTRTIVRMRDAGVAEIRAYVACGESADKAGSYALQGGGGAFVAAVIGDTANVVGLPVDQIRPWLERAGVYPADQTA